MTRVRPLQQFVGLTPAKCVYPDNSQEIRKAVAQLGLLHSCDTPYRPETSGVVERAVRSVLDGTRSVLLHAGLPHWYWPYACRYFCFMKTVQLTDGISAWTSRHGEGRFPGQAIPFGALVSFLPAPVVKRLSLIHI